MASITHRHGVAQSSSALPKVAIPRLPHQELDSRSREIDRRRVSRACNACRAHKVKCSGDSPTCTNCQVTGRTCAYVLPRRDRLKSVTEQSLQMGRLLKEMRCTASSEDASRISHMLQALRETVPEAQSLLLDLEVDHDAVVFSAPGASTVSLDSIDTDSIDPLLDSSSQTDEARSQAFVGSHSEVQWLRGICLQLGQIEVPSPVTQDGFPVSPIIQHTTSATSAAFENAAQLTFYLDDENMDLDLEVNPLELPSLETADSLLSSFFSSVQNSFPILPEKFVTKELPSFLEALRNGQKPQRWSKKLALLNLLFAIGAKYTHLTLSPYRADKHDHVLYQTRAQAHGLVTIITDSPNLEQIQITGLLAFYHLITGHVNQAWVLSGLAIRFAYALGLHVRNDDPKILPQDKEANVRTWWSLYLLERILCNITGRPCIQMDSFCSVPFPSPLNDTGILVNISARYHSAGVMDVDLVGATDSDASLQSMSRGLYLKALANIAIITQDIVRTLYSVGATLHTWEGIHHAAIQYSTQLASWAQSLPDELAPSNLMRRGSYPVSTKLTRERTVLSLHYLSAEILLARPFLVKGGSEIWEYQDNTLGTFTQRTGRKCIDAASAVAAMLPNTPNATSLYETGPWWCIIHYLMQAVSVLLHGITLAVPGSQEANNMVADVRKLMRWLQSMQENDTLARRAYETLHPIAEAVEARTVINMPISFDPNAQIPISSYEQHSFMDHSQAQHHPLFMASIAEEPSRLSNISQPQGTAFSVPDSLFAPYEPNTFGPSVQDPGSYHLPYQRPPPNNPW